MPFTHYDYERKYTKMDKMEKTLRNAEKTLYDIVNLTELLQSASYDDHPIACEGVVDLINRLANASQIDLTDCILHEYSIPRERDELSRKVEKRA